MLVKPSAPRFVASTLRRMAFLTFFECLKTLIQLKKTSHFVDEKMELVHGLASPRSEGFDPPSPPLALLDPLCIGNIALTTEPTIFLGCLSGVTALTQTLPVLPVPEQVPIFLVRYLVVQVSRRDYRWSVSAIDVSTERVLSEITLACRSPS
jgi:hypothetical protein